MHRWIAVIVGAVVAVAMALFAPLFARPRKPRT
jgi:hypothetical protein